MRALKRPWAFLVGLNIIRFGACAFDVVVIGLRRAGHAGLPVHIGEAVSAACPDADLFSLPRRLMCGRIRQSRGTEKRYLTMLQHFFAYQVEAMRRAAKQISRNEGIPYSEAQNRIAREKGYRNWSLLQKNGLQDPNVRPQFFFRRTDEEVASPMRFVPDPGPYARQTRSQVAQACVTDLCQRFADAKNAFDFAIAYLEAVLNQPRFRVFTDAPIYWEMRCWLPYVIHPVDDQKSHCIVLNRNYKPAGMTSREHVRYENFPHLHMMLEGESWRNFAYSGAEEAYLFKDDSRPWLSRQAASAYLDRLRKVEA